MTMRWMATAVAAIVLAGYPAVPSARQESEDARRLRDAATSFGEIMSAEDKAIPKAILGKAEAIAIFPGTVKAGFVVGGMRGRGVISARTSGTWSAPAFLTLTGGSFGLQIGGQAADIVLVINGRRGLDSLISNQFKLGADAAVAAGPVGRDAQAATDLQLRAQILSYSRARGLFAGVTVNGSTVRPDRDANERFYLRQAARDEADPVRRCAGESTAGGTLAGDAEPLRALTLRGVDGSKRLIKNRIAKLEPHLVRLGWKYALPGEDRVCHFAKQDLQREARGRHERGTPKYSPQRAREFEVRHWIRCGHVQRARHRFLFKRPAGQGHPIVAMNP